METKKVLKRKRKCLTCERVFFVVLPPSREKAGRGKFCSRDCKVVAFKGRHLSPKTEFKKGMKVFFSKEHRRKIGLALKGKPGNKGAVNGKWKGNKVGYSALHHWVTRNKEKPLRCQKCHKERKIQWANKSHKYKRDLNDWIPLCHLCHREYDRKNGWGLATKKYPELCKKIKNQ